MSTEEKQTTKKCPKCGNEDLVLISTHNIKVCVLHVEHVLIPWYKEEGQVTDYT